MAFGMGYFVLGGFSTVFIVGSLLFIKKLDPYVKKDRYLTVTVTARNRDSLYDELNALISEQGYKIADISSQVDLQEDDIFFKMVVTQQRKRIGRELSAAIARLEGIKKIFYD
jgi:putative Mg2+ transporter-C (MgtC) family protein